MVYLIWSLINTLILLYFLYLIIGYIVKGKRIFNPRFKNVSIFIIIIGILQILSSSNSEEANNRIPLSENYKHVNDINIKEVNLEENISFKINMSIMYTVNQDKVIPIESYSFLTGFGRGFDWELKSFTINYILPNGDIKFHAWGILIWNLFGIDIYSQSKEFEGTIVIQNPAANTEL